MRVLQEETILHTYIAGIYDRERFRNNERCWEQILKAFKTAIDDINSKLSLASRFLFAPTSKEHVVIIVPSGVDPIQALKIADLVNETFRLINKEYKIGEEFYLSHSWDCRKRGIASTVLLPLLRPKLVEAGIFLPVNSENRVKVRLDLSNGDTFGTEALEARVSGRMLIVRVRPCSTRVSKSIGGIKALNELCHGLPACPFVLDEVDFTTGWKLRETVYFSGVTVEKITCE